MECPRKNGQSPPQLDGYPRCDHGCCRHGALPPGVAAGAADDAGEREPADGAAGAVTDAGLPPRFGTQSYCRGWVIWFRSGWTPFTSRLMPTRTFIGLYCSTSRFLRGPILSALQMSVSNRWPISTACWF